MMLDGRHGDGSVSGDRWREDSGGGHVAFVVGLLVFMMIMMVAMIKMMVVMVLIDSGGNGSWASNGAAW